MLAMSPLMRAPADAIVFTSSLISSISSSAPFTVASTETSASSRPPLRSSMMPSTLAMVALIC
jgi:hypothetical protein